MFHLFVKFSFRNGFLRNVILRKTSNAKFTVSTVSPIYGLNPNVIQNSNSRSFCALAEKWVTITFLKANGTKVKRRGVVGKDSIQDLVEQDDPEIPGYGACGGTLSCSTCHVIFTIEDFDRLFPTVRGNDEALDVEERDLICYAPDNCDTSRLGCNVKLTEAMDGIVVKVPLSTLDLRDEFDK